MSASDRPITGDTRSIVAICTKDRPEDIEASCSAAHATAPGMPLLVLDASSTDATERVCKSLLQRHGSSLKLSYRRARRPGLARQRNEAIGLCRRLGVDIVHFIDDDTEVLPGYFEAIERRFRQDAAVAGIGGIIVNQPVFDHLAVRSFFLLRSRRHGSVLRSGRKMLGQYPGTPHDAQVDWLNGCSMSYRMSVFEEFLFDDRLEGPSLGEDYDFSFRLSRRRRLAVEPEARCIHLLTPTARSAKRSSAREDTVNVYRRVREYKDLGLSSLAFWWSTFGELVLHIGSWLVLRREGAGEEVRGIIDGIVEITRTMRPTGLQEHRPDARARTDAESP